VSAFHPLRTFVELSSAAQLAWSKEGPLRTVVAATQQFGNLPSPKSHAHLILARDMPTASVGARASHSYAHSSGTLLVRRCGKNASFAAEISSLNHLVPCG
jgi:hypothetical protein